MRYRVHIEMSRDGYPLRLNTALLVGGSSQGVAKARALELAWEQHPECDDFRVYHVCESLWGPDGEHDVSHAEKRNGQAEGV